MTDPVTLILDGMKKLRELSGKIKDAEVKNAIADLSILLADVKIQVAELKTENLELRHEVERLTEAPNIRANLVHRDGVYYLRQPREGQTGGPYCPRCLDVAEITVLLTKTSSVRAMAEGAWACPECKQYFGQAKPPEIGVVHVG